ncbi:hypothetical protein JMJ35_008226 [Cladonia borealis]|uniref:Heterokaryon incompatibility domain-containing protein n=1 Tax=Cladonia borealis TaxID=184061 RepID=A0AA39UZK1_9LECA|nr:hypothetical protein JMJ35_008226 [Cladonia borealis]
MDVPMTVLISLPPYDSTKTSSDELDLRKSESIQVASLSYCCDLDCDFTENIHLEVKLYQHTRLAGWTNYAPLKKKEKLRITLARIPSIYRTLDVVILMPGCPCQCLSRIAAEAFEDLKINDWNAAWSVGKELIRCLGSMGLCSYFDRVWTRQEVLYSRRIRLVWTRLEESPCVKPEEELLNLVGYARLLRDRSEKKDKRFLYLDLANRKLFYTMAQLLGFYSASLSNETYDGPANNEVLIQFLSGPSINNGQPISLEMNVDDQIQRFAHRMAFLSTSARTTTKEWDYITSVWVDCPGYEIPKDHETVGIARLLENAIRQFEKLHRKSINVCAPAGLFEYGCSERALWRPTKYLHERPHNTIDIYAPICQPICFIPVASMARVPLDRLDNAAVAISQRCLDFAVAFSNKTTAEVFEQLKGVVNLWAEEAVRKIFTSQAGRYVSLNGLVLEEAMQFKFELLLCLNAWTKYAFPGIEGPYVMPNEGRSWSGANIDHEKAAYHLVTSALGLDARNYWKKGLRLLVSFEGPPCIGLAAFNQKDADEKVDSDQQITLYIGKMGKSSGYSLLEVTQMQRDSENFAVTGIWVPRRTTPFEVIGALIMAETSEMFHSWW